MDSNAFIAIALKIFAVLVLVLFNAFFVAAELAFVRIRDTQLAPLADKGNRRARRARNIVAHIDSYISATQLGITLVSLALGVTVEPVFETLLAPIFNLLQIASPQTRSTVAIIVGFIVNCFLLIIIGELVPKAIAIRRTLQTALLVSRPLTIFYRTSFPFIWLLHHSSQLVLHWLGFSREQFADAHSEEELRLVLASAQNAPDRRSLILNALDLRHRTARDVMRPRNEIVVFNSDAKISDCMAIAEKTRYSRFPICINNDVDKTLGVIHIKDLYAMRERAHTATDLLPLARKIICVPESARLDRLLQRFLEKKMHFALVVDEFGGTLGVITLENALEAIVGQIQDEYDSEKLELARRSEGVWEAAGTLPLHELEKIIGQVQHDENVATVSGWVTQQLSSFPKVGDKFSAGDFELRVEEMDGPRVAKLRITRQRFPEGSTIIVRRDTKT